MWMLVFALAKMKRGRRSLLYSPITATAIRATTVSVSVAHVVCVVGEGREGEEAGRSGWSCGWIEKRGQV